MPTLADVHIAAQLSRAESAERRGYARALRTVARAARRHAFKVRKTLRDGAWVADIEELEKWASRCERRAREVERDARARLAKREG